MTSVASLRQHVGRFASSAGCWQCRLASTQAKTREETKATLAAKVTSSLRGDEHGDSLTLDPASKKIKTAAGDLPISPVMDPDWMEARQRFKAPKPNKATSNGSHGRFRKKLYLNPFARALATPWRVCSVTKSGMPRYFLQDFQVVAHPETKDPWWAPGDLDAQHEDKLLAENPSPEVPSPHAPSVRPSTNPVGYIISRSDVIEGIGASRQETKLSGQHVGMIAGRTHLGRTGIIPKLVWRPDMHRYLLADMRRRAVDDLLHLARLRTEAGRSHLVPCAGWADIDKDLAQRGCVLWHSGRRGVEAPPGQMATLAIEGAAYERSLPVHNLDALLGEEQLARLRGEEIFRDNALVVVRKRMSLGVQLRLWKLQGYLAEY